MERRKFIVTTAVLTAFGSDLMAFSKENNEDKDGFLVKSGKARHGKHTPYQGVNPNDLKISCKNTDGLMPVFEYICIEKTGAPLCVHLEQDEVFEKLKKPDLKSGFFNCDFFYIDSTSRAYIKIIFFN